MVKKGELNVPQKDNHKGDEDLKDKLKNGGQRLYIIYHSHYKDKRCAEEEDFHAGVIDVIKQDGGRKSEVNGQPPEQGGGTVMDLSPIRLVQDIQLQGNKTAQGGDKVGGNNSKDEDILPPQPGIKVKYLGRGSGQKKKKQANQGLPDYFKGQRGFLFLSKGGGKLLQWIAP